MAPAMAPRVLLWLTVLRLAPSTESVRAAVPWNIVEMRIGCPTPDGMGLRSGGMVLQRGDKATAGMGALLGSLPRKAPSWVALRVAGGWNKCPRLAVGQNVRLKAHLETWTRLLGQVVADDRPDPGGTVTISWAGSPRSHYLVNAGDLTGKYTYHIVHLP